MINCSIIFFFTDTATPDIYTLSLHDALPISLGDLVPVRLAVGDDADPEDVIARLIDIGYARVEMVSKRDRKSTRLNSSHSSISYAVFCLKKKMERRRVLGQHRMARGDLLESA